jgi:glucose/arabinose dehydrogenase
MKQSTLLLVQAFIFSTCFLIFSRIIAQPVLGFSGFITSGLSSPVDITHAGDGTNRLFIVQQGGQIRIHNGNTLLPAPFLDISTSITSGGERGLLSLAFHPDYETNRYFFVYYTNTSGDITIARYRTLQANPNLADENSGVVLMNIPKPFSNHNGGDLNFGPDGYLYFATGDGGSGGDPNNLAQNGGSLLGKMIRINVAVDDLAPAPYYTIPPDNPYVGDPNVDDHIWAIGLRNPWRWSFDRLTNDMWIADVGQGAWEEINFRPAAATGGINYGWRCYEGNAAYNTSGCAPQNSYISPIFQYPHVFATGGFSVTGGFVYRGAEFPSLQGYYTCADYVSGNVWLINPNGSGGWITRLQPGLPGNISAFGEAENGTLYAVSLNGQVYKVNVTTVLPVTLLSFSGSRKQGFNELQWKTASEENLGRFIIEYSTDGRNYQYAGAVAATGNLSGSDYTFNHYTTETRKLFYRLRIEELSGEERLSSVISIGVGDGALVRVYPTVITNNTVQINTEQNISSLQLMDAAGRLVFSNATGLQTGYFTIALPALSKGPYWLRIQKDSGTEVVKVFVQ